MNMKRGTFVALLVFTLLLGVLLGTAIPRVSAAGPKYKVVESPGRDAPLTKYEQVFNDMAAQGWQFDNWLYRGSVQTPDLVFKR